MKTCAATFVVLASVSLSATGYAGTLDYPNFGGDVSGLQINGDAARVGNVMRVTPSLPNQAGSVFSKTSIPLDNLKTFSTRFQFNISNPGGISDQDGQGADGIVFAVQTVANTAGGTGGAIGYGGLPNSVGVEFDTWNNGAGDNNDGNHVGFDLNGNMASALLTHVADRMNNGQNWTAWVDYDGTTLAVRLNETGVRPDDPLLQYNVDLAAILGVNNAFVGFTSGTGDGFGDHDILNWRFESEYNPIGSVPETCNSLVLFAFACLGLGMCSRHFAGRRLA